MIQSVLIKLTESMYYRYKTDNINHILERPINQRRQTSTSKTTKNYYQKPIHQNQIHRIKDSISYKVHCFYF